MRTLISTALLLFAGFACESNVGTLSLHLVYSPLPRQAPFESGASTLRVEIFADGKQVAHREASLSAGEIEVPPLPVNTDYVIVVSGIGPEGNIVSRGTSTTIRYTPGETTLDLFVGLINRFSQTSEPLQVARAFHRTTLLGDGRLIVTGGTEQPWRPNPQDERIDSALIGTAAAEVIDGNALVASEILNMTLPRLGHSTTALPSNNLLVAGGIVDARTLNNPQTLNDPQKTEIFSPGADISTNAFFSSTALRQARAFHGASTQNGRIVLVGGATADGIATPLAESYTQGRVARLPQLAEARHTFPLLTLPDETLVAIGGRDRKARALRSIEILRSNGTQWEDGGDLIIGRSNHRAVLLPDGGVLVIGGLNQDGAAVASIERYDPSARRSQIVAELATPRWAHEASLLPDGRIIATGGFAFDRNGSPSDSYEEIIMLEDKSFRVRRRCCLTIQRAGHTANVLESGWLYLTGGITNGANELQVTNTSEVFVYTAPR